MRVQFGTGVIATAHGGVFHDPMNVPVHGIVAAASILFIVTCFIPEAHYASD
jgi:hypothetical protein